MIPPNVVDKDDSTLLPYTRSFILSHLRGGLMGGPLTDNVGK